MGVSGINSEEEDRGCPDFSEAIARSLIFLHERQNEPLLNDCLGVSAAAFAAAVSAAGGLEEEDPGGGGRLRGSRKQGWKRTVRRRKEQQRPGMK